MTVTVLGPDDAGLTALGDVEGVRPVRYDVREPLAPEAAEAEVLVPGFLRAEDSGFFDALPRLRLVQLLTARTKNWLDRLPPGCCCPPVVVPTGSVPPSGRWRRYCRCIGNWRSSPRSVSVTPGNTVPPTPCRVSGS